MASEWSLVINGTAVPFDQYGAIITGMQGVGMAPVRNIISPYALNPGGAHQRTKVESRSVILQAVLPGTSIANLHQLRSRLIDMIRPDRDTTQQPITLRYTGGSIPVELQAYYDAGLEWSNPVGYTEALAMRFIAPYPYWASTAKNEGTLSVSGTGHLKNLAIMTGVSSYPIDSQLGFRSDSQAIVRPQFGTVHPVLGTLTYSAMKGMFMPEYVVTDSYDNLFALAGTMNTTFHGYNRDGLMEFRSTAIVNTSIARRNNSVWERHAGSVTSGTPIVVHSAVCATDDSIWVATNTFDMSVSPTKGTLTTYVYSWNKNGGWLSAGTIQKYHDGQGINTNTLKKGIAGNVFIVGNNGKDTSEMYNNTIFIGNRNVNNGIIAAYPFAPSLSNNTSIELVHRYNGVIDIKETLLYVYAAINLHCIAYNIGTSFAALTSLIRLTKSTGAWQSLGRVNGNIYTLSVTNNDIVYAGGDFNGVIGATITATHIVRHNGSQWEAIGNFNAPVHYLRYSVATNKVHAAGEFTAINGTVPLMTRVASFSISSETWKEDGLLRQGTSVPSIDVLNNGQLVLYGDLKEATVSQNHTIITVTGNARVAPIIMLRNKGFSGYIHRITNHTTNDTIYFQGLFLMSSEICTLDLQRSAFTSNIRGNMIRFVRAGSRIVNWLLVPGENVVEFECDLGSQVQASYNHTNNYWSIDL